MNIEVLANQAKIGVTKIHLALSGNQETRNKEALIISIIKSLGDFINHQNQIN